MEAKKYRAVDSNGREFEVALAKRPQPAKPVMYARAPGGDGYKRTPSQNGGR